MQLLILLVWPTTTLDSHFFFHCDIYSLSPFQNHIGPRKRSHRLSHACRVCCLHFRCLPPVRLLSNMIKYDSVVETLMLDWFRMPPLILYQGQILDILLPMPRSATIPSTPVPFAPPGLRYLKFLTMVDSTKIPPSALILSTSHHIHAVCICYTSHDHEPKATTSWVPKRPQKVPVICFRK